MYKINVYLPCTPTLATYLLSPRIKRVKAGQTEFTVYRHRPHGFSDFAKNFQISDPIQQSSGRTHSSALISGRGSGDLELELEHSHPSLSTSLKYE